MKHFKKMMALIIALIMVVGTLSTMSTALAADGDAKSDSSITVTDLAKGDVVTYYQVIQWTDSGWAFKAPFTSLSADDLEEIVGDQTADPPVAGKITQEMANKIAAAAISGGTTEPALSGTTWTLNNPVPGLYMVVVAAAEPLAVYNPIFVAADFKEGGSNEISSSATYSNTSVAKKYDDSVKKTTEDKDSAIAAAIDSHVGEDATFYVDTNVPVYLASYKNPTFEIKDEIKTNGITFKTGTIKITLTENGTDNTYEVPSEGLDNTKFTAAENGVKGYTVTFKEAYLKGNPTPVKVHIEYQGTITNKAEFNVNEDNNEVTITYSNGPGTEKGALRDRTNHYTFSIGAKAFGYEDVNGKTYELIKVGVDSEGKPVVSVSNVTEWSEKTERHPLTGATFGLFNEKEDAEAYTGGKPADAAAAEAAGFYINGNYPNGATFTTADDGILTFTGLASGTYYVKEIIAPNGFLKDTRVAEVDIKAYYKTVTIPATEENGIPIAAYDVDVLDYYTVSVNNVSVYNSETEQYEPLSQGSSIVNTYTFDNNKGPTISTPEVSTYKDGDLVNTQGVELPSTGGVGTTIFYIIGAILVIGAGIILVTRRRMSAE